MSQASEIFDDIVIGTSPLMLLQAQHLALAGRHVCVLDRKERFGGAWQTAMLGSDEEVEIACHLIEFFPKVYEKLEEASGVPFVPLEAQPVRVNKLNIVIPYFNKVLLLASGGRLLLGFIKAAMELITKKTPDRNKFINFQTKFWSWLRYQTPILFTNTTMKGPKDGFVDFLDNLVLRCEQNGVVFRVADVSSLVRSKDTWRVETNKDKPLIAYHIHCTTSTNLRIIGPGRLQATQQNLISRCAIAVDIPSKNVNISQTYVAFWQHSSIARVSRVDRPGNFSNERFLVELHSENLVDAIDFEELIGTWMAQAGIIKRRCQMHVIGKVSYQYTANVDQLPAGKIEDGLWGYYSVGNLAAGVAHWLTLPRVPNLPHT